MAKLQFRERIPINVHHTLMQLLSRFRGVKDGLPELIKNSKDQYSRLGVTNPAHRTIVVIVNTAAKSIGVIDFAGATADQFKRWETWSDPTANARDKASDIEGGHGNGGKAFMVLGSSTDSSFESCHDGRRTRMGYENDSERSRFKPGIAVEDGMAVEDQRIESTRKQLDDALADLGLPFDQLPKPAQETFHDRQSYTIAQVNGVADWAKAREETVRRAVSEMRRSVETHPQAALTLESCEVWFVVDGQVVGDTPARVEYPEPFPGFDEPLVIPVPDEVTDPQTGETVGTGSGDEQSRVLTLRTSTRSLRTEDMRPLHLIRIRNGRNVVGLWSVADLSPGASSGFVFGELSVPALEGEHLVGADRQSLNDTPLVRGLRGWTADQVKDLADKIQQATAKEHRPEDRNKVNQSLNKLRDLMREFLAERDRGEEGAGQGQRGEGSGGAKPPSPPQPPKGEVVNVIELEGKAASIAIAVGATVPLRVKAFEQTPAGELRPVPSPKLVAKMDRTDLLQVDEANQATASADGITTVWFESEDGNIKSNTVAIENVSCTGANITGIPERLLLQGEILPIKVIYTTEGGGRDDLLHGASVDEIGMGRISRNGVYVAGSQEGTATLRVRWGINQVDTVSASTVVGPERVPPRRGTGGDTGGEIPLILLCGTSVPGMEHYPLEQRTIMPSEHLPTIIDFDPAFENVIFINPDSKESIQARRGRGGRKGMAGIATETYYQFVAMKCFEILKRLWVFEQARQAPLTEVQFRERFATAETECAPFIEDAYKVAEAIAEVGARPA
jgi:hypothetical protein